jgi:formylglycine-generating enzyme required for sulfatase activity/dienelactone hydrolase
LWQVLGVYLVASWAVLGAVDTLGGALNLPEWFPSVALAFLVVGLPVVLATAFVQERGSRTTLTETTAEAVEAPDAKGGDRPQGRPTGVSRLLTWRNATLGGVGAFALWGVLTAGWLIFAGGTLGATDSASIVLSAVAEVDAAVDRGDGIEAYNLARSLPPQVPDSVREAIFVSVSAPGTILSTPSGASVSWRPYDRPDVDLEVVGTTPLEWQAPRARVVFQVELEGYVSRAAAARRGSASVRLRAENAVQADALHIPGQPLSPAMVEARLANDMPAELGEYLIDRFEVTNRQYKEFVDAGAYERAEFWEYPFDREGEELTRAEAMTQFVDLTGRTGPSTWTGGSFPEGTADYPVTGISWYEAAAYANFAGRQLPTLYHWYAAARPTAAAWIVPFSNFGGEGLAPVGDFAGVTPVGAYDMAGNAREWLANATENQRYTAGGGWNDPPYLFSLTQPQPPFDRSETNGLRLMTDLGDPAAFAITNRPVEPVVRDFYSETPASDELFTEFARLYEYSNVPLNELVEAVDTVAVGVREKITFDAGYGQERMVLYLFRPVEQAGPRQTVLFFPGSGALASTALTPGFSSQTISMVVRSGRNFAFPVYKSTFERQDDYVYRLQDPSNEHREHVIQWRQDLGRSLDYLQTRPDVDSDRFGYFGLSWGGRMGGIMLAVEPRFGAAVLGVPGLSPLPTQPSVDPFNFVPHVQLPVLMLSGEYDATYPLETSARPFFDFLGTAETDKKHFVSPGGHSISTIDLTRETLDWFDRYLGEVR